MPTTINPELAKKLLKDPYQFTPYCNAWGFEEPGPKCPYCDEYQCYCSVVLPNEDKYV